MSNESTLPGSIISLLIGWLPVLLLIGLMLLVISRLGYLRRGAMNHRRYTEEYLNETKRQNAVLAALLTKMDAPLSLFEAAGRDAKKPDA
jgi:hypothetical protein